MYKISFHYFMIDSNQGNDKIFDKNRLQHGGKKALDFSITIGLVTLVSDFKVKDKTLTIN